MSGRITVPRWIRQLKLIGKWPDTVPASAGKYRRHNLVSGLAASRGIGLAASLLARRKFELEMHMPLAISVHDSEVRLATICAPS